nr:MAG TPA: endonuclease [Caudoviricetes sp.]
MNNYKNWIAQAEILYRNGTPYSRIAKELGVNRKTVSYRLRQLGYESDKRYVRIISPDKLRKYDYQYADSLFEKIDTEEKAYWLGFLYADGDISDSHNTISLALAEKDLEHVKKFRDFWHMEEKPITMKVRHLNGKSFTSYEFAVTSKKIKDDLLVLGCFPRKTFKIKFPTDDIVPSVLKHHFVRGYLDGDGCITKPQISNVSVEILGTEDFLDGYQKWTGLHYNKLHEFKTTEIKHSMYAGKYAEQILNKIYNDATVFLQRKYDLYLKYCRPELKTT